MTKKNTFKKKIKKKKKNLFKKNIMHGRSGDDIPVSKTKQDGQIDTCPTFCNRFQKFLTQCGGRELTVGYLSGTQLGDTFQPYH